MSENEVPNNKISNKEEPITPIKEKSISIVEHKTSWAKTPEENIDSTDNKKLEKLSKEATEDTVPILEYIMDLSKRNTKALEKLCLEVELHKKVDEKLLEFLNMLTKKPTQAQEADNKNKDIGHVPIKPALTDTVLTGTPIGKISIEKQTEKTPTQKEVTPLSTETQNKINIVIEDLEAAEEGLSKNVRFDIDKSSNFIQVYPLGYLQTEIFKKINQVLKDHHGIEYKSNGRNTHWDIVRFKVN